MCELRTDAQGRPAVSRVAAPAVADGAASSSSAYVLGASGPEGGTGEATSTTTAGPRRSEVAAASVAIVRVGALLLAALALVWGGVLQSWAAGRGRRGHGEEEEEEGREVELEAVVVGLDVGGAGERADEDQDAGERGPLLRPAACIVYGSTH